MILKESPERLAELAKMHKNKILSMRDHLDTLLRKRYRIDLEIKHLRKQITDKKKKSEFNLKLSLGAESITENPLSNEEIIFLTERYPSLSQSLEEYDLAMQEVLDFLAEVDQLEIIRK